MRSLEKQVARDREPGAVRQLAELKADLVLLENLLNQRVTEDDLRGMMHRLPVILARLKAALPDVDASSLETAVTASVGIPYR